MRPFSTCVSLGLLALGASPAFAQSEVTTDWPDRRLEVGGLLQIWAVPFDQNDVDTQDPVVLGDPNLDEGFSLHRARLYIHGDLSKTLSYHFMMGYYAGFTGNDAANDVRPELGEAYLDFHRERGPSIRLGIDKVPFGAQFMTSSRTLLFAERSIASEELGFGRDVGVQLLDAYNLKNEGSFSLQRFAWSLGMFNGSGTAYRDDNGIGDEGVSVDALSNPFGTVNTLRLEADFGSTAGPTTETGMHRSFKDVTLRLGASAAGNRNLSARQVRIGLDFGLYAGPLSLQAEALVGNSIPMASMEDVDPELSKIPTNGWYLQAGAFVVPDQLQLAGRVERFDGNTFNADDEDLMVYTFGLNYFPKKTDSLKLQLNYVHRVELPQTIKIDNDSVYGVVSAYF